MNQRRYIEHNLFLQSSNSKYINQVLLNISLNILLKSCESSYQNISRLSCESLTKVLTQHLTQVLLRSYSSHVKVLTQHLTQVLHNISPRDFNEFGNTFFYS